MAGLVKRTGERARYGGIMTLSIARYAFAVSAFALAATARPALAVAGCSTDAFTVSGTPLAVEICAPATRPAGKAAPIATATLSSRNATPLVRKIALDVVPGDEASHTIDDAPLQSLGIAGTLHMTIGYKGGTVRLEHALLVPGAIALK